jgi:hypothetical protein
VDERLMKRCLGKPIPEWDLAHRLPTDRFVSSEVQDAGTIFCSNSTYMDVVEPSLFEKHWSITAAMFAFLCVGVGPYAYYVVHSGPAAPDFWMAIFNFMALAITAGCALGACMAGRGLLFAVSHRPIRFHRGERKLYAIRKRRFFAKPGEGDVVWEVPWSNDSIFCLHREMSTFGELFHIRHYTVDDHGKVTRVFSIGREWMPAAEVELALAQWNYWCKFMNDGPNGLPKPMLFHTENETPRESFLFSLYGVGMDAPAIWRIVMMPLILLFTLMRILANATSRNPVWPESIQRISQVAADDPYAQPRAGTPVGWGETVLARRRGDYPINPKARVEDWKGEDDATRHAALWLDNPATPAG